jgi:photosystem II stability/assembly factor-like uncharacterized protein
VTGTIWTVKFINSQTGFASADAGGFIKTTNSGTNWNSYSTGTGGTAWSVFFTDIQTGYICTDGGGIRKTTNGGINWTAQSSGTTQLLHWVFFPTTGTGNTGYICGWGGTILKTIDAGNNWNTQISGTGQNLRSSYFPNVNTGWVTGDNGTILKTTTGGITTIQLVNNEIPSEFKLYQNFPNPFNPSTNMLFELPKSSFVQLIVYDLLGRETEKLVSQELKAGTYKVDWNASNYPGGTYFYKLTAGGFVETKKMILVK